MKTKKKSLYSPCGPRHAACVPVGAFWRFSHGIQRRITEGTKPARTSTTAYISFSSSFLGNYKKKKKKTRIELLNYFFLFLCSWGKWFGPTGRQRLVLTCPCSEVVALKATAIQPIGLIVSVDAWWDFLMHPKRRVVTQPSFASSSTFMPIFLPKKKKKTFMPIFSLFYSLFYSQKIIFG